MRKARATSQRSSRRTPRAHTGRRPRARGSQWFVYIITNALGSLYTGITTDVTRRLREHRDGRRGARFFRFGAAVQVLYVERRRSRAGALRREAAIKRMSRGEKQTLIARRASASAPSPA